MEFLSASLLGTSFCLHSWPTNPDLEPLGPYVFWDSECYGNWKDNVVHIPYNAQPPAPNGVCGGIS